jgi:threonine/homoserine/homoserine lactone efflux protein
VRGVQKSGLAVGAISFGTLLAFAATCLVIELAPGPNMAYLAVLSASKGRRAGFAATLGIALGLLIVGLAAALGLTAIIANSRWVYEALRWGGVFYLLWLAWEGWRGQEKKSPGNADPTPHDSRFFMRGLVTNLINPKAGIFYVAVLPTFVDETRPLVGQAVTLSAALHGRGVNGPFMVSFAVRASWSKLAETARRIPARCTRTIGRRPPRLRGALTRQRY